MSSSFHHFPHRKPGLSKKKLKGHVLRVHFLQKNIWIKILHTVDDIDYDGLIFPNIHHLYASVSRISIDSSGSARHFLITKKMEDSFKCQIRTNNVQGLWRGEWIVLAAANILLPCPHVALFFFYQLIIRLQYSMLHTNTSVSISASHQHGLD